jgi:Arc/MetJ-type ribon-helix-helix transcriptional regulator
VNVALTPEVQALIDSELKCGNFSSAGEFLSAAVQHFLIARELGEAYTAREVEEKIARGLDQIERGETIDGDEAFLQLRSDSAERRRRSA